MDGSRPGSSIRGIFHRRVLEWVATSFSNAWKWKVKVKLLSRVWLLASNPMDCSLPGSSIHGIFQARVLEWGAIAFSTTIVWPQVKNFEGIQPHPSTENWIKDLLSLAPPIRTRPVSPSVSLSHQEAFTASYPSPSEGRQTENHKHRKLTNLITWTTALSNSMKLRAKSCRVTEDGQVMVVSSDKTWSTGEGNGKPFQYSCLENPMNSIEKGKREFTERWTPQVGRCPICYWRSVEK